eukprot:9633275-Karenia_brevis.AAC.1
MTPTRPGRPSRMWFRHHNMDSGIASETSDEAGEADDEMPDSSDDEPMPEMQGNPQKEGIAPW